MALPETEAVVTADEARIDYISKMGSDLGEVYHYLWQEIAFVHQKWDEYVELFGTKPSRIDLMNEAAPAFFRMIQDSLWEDTLLHIARLTDRPEVARKDTLTILRLPQIVDSAVAHQVAAAIDAAKVACAFARDWRNRRIAHNDLLLMTKQSAVPLTPASREDVRKALDSIVNVLDVVSRHYTGGTNLFKWAGMPEGAVALLHVLRDGVRERDARHARWDRGEIDSIELQPTHV
jgi:hypothetical protein